MQFIAFFLTLLLALLPASAAAQEAPAPFSDLLSNPCSTADLAQVHGGGGSHEVRVHNPNGGDLAVRTSLDVNHIHGPSAAPLNCAAALNGNTGAVDGFACVGCQSIAVALQINVIGRDTPRFGPRNVATARNVRCDGCVAIAIAIQHTVQVEDTDQLPQRSDTLRRAIDRKAFELHSNHGLSAEEAAAQVIDVLNQFNDLVTQIDVQRSEAVSP
jgi:hypothetical protein